MSSSLEYSLSTLVRKCDNSFVLEDIQYPDNIFLLDTPIIPSSSDPGVYVYHTSPAKEFNAQKLIRSIHSFLSSRQHSIGPITKQTLTLMDKTVCDETGINYVDVSGDQYSGIQDRYYDPYCRCETYSQHTVASNLMLVVLFQYLFYQQAPNPIEQSIYKTQVERIAYKLRKTLNVWFLYRLKFSKTTVLFTVVFSSNAEYSFTLSKDYIRCNQHRIVYDDFYFEYRKSDDILWTLERSFLGKSILDMFVEG